MFLIQSTVNMEASSRFLNQSLIERHRDSLNKVEGPANKDDLFESITHNLKKNKATVVSHYYVCLLYTSPSPRDREKSRMPSSA